MALFAVVTVVVAVGTIHVGWKSKPEQLRQLNRGWPLFGIVGFTRIWRSQVAGIIWLALFVVAVAVLGLTEKYPAHSEGSVIGAVIAAVLIGVGFLLVIVVSFTGRPKVLVPPNLRDIDLSKLKARSARHTRALK